MLLLEDGSGEQVKHSSKTGVFEVELTVGDMLEDFYFTSETGGGTVKIDKVVDDTGNKPVMRQQTMDDQELDTNVKMRARTDVGETAPATYKVFFTITGMTVDIYYKKTSSYV